MRRVALGIRPSERARGGFVSPRRLSGRCDGQLVSVELQQVVRGGDQPPF